MLSQALIIHQLRGVNHSSLKVKHDLFVHIFLKLVLVFCYSDLINGINHLVRTQNYLKKQYFLPPDIQRYVCILGKGNATFQENFAYVLNESQMMCSIKNDLRLATIPNVIKRHGLYFPQYELEKFSFAVHVLLRNKIV